MEGGLKAIAVWPGDNPETALELLGSTMDVLGSQNQLPTKEYIRSSRSRQSNMPDMQLSFASAIDSRWLISSSFVSS